MAAETPSTPPSMEAILASIKRVIGQAPTEPSPPPGAPPAAVPEEEDVLELGTPLVPPVGAAPAAPLVSDATRAAGARAMAALATLSIDPAAAPHTLDGLVRELLRPMLKDWLDANLPELVERVVAREVARLVGR